MLLRMGIGIKSMNKTLLFLHGHVTERNCILIAYKYKNTGRQWYAQAKLREFGILCQDLH